MRRKVIVLALLTISAPLLSQGRGGPADESPATAPAKPSIPAPIGGSWYYRLSNAAQIANADEYERQSRESRLVASSFASDLTRQITAKLEPCGPGTAVVIIKFGTISTRFQKSGADELALFPIHRIGEPGSIGTATIVREPLTPSEELKQRKRLFVRSVDDAARSNNIDIRATPEVTACG